MRSWPMGLRLAGFGEKTLVTRFGDVTIRRRMYRDSDGETMFPLVDVCGCARRDRNGHPGQGRSQYIQWIGPAKPCPQRSVGCSESGDDGVQRRQAHSESDEETWYQLDDTGSQPNDQDDPTESERRAGEVLSQAVGTTRFVKGDVRPHATDLRAEIGPAAGPTLQYPRRTDSTTPDRGRPSCDAFFVMPTNMRQAPSGGGPSSLPASGRNQGNTT